jgi:two-component system, NtrC family, sensor kinase
VLSKWPIRLKLLLGLGLLVLVVSILSGTGLVATNAYRSLVNSLSWRVSELPLAADISRNVSDLRITVGELRGLRVNPFPDIHNDLLPERVPEIRDKFYSQLDEMDLSLARYREQLATEAKADPLISDHGREEETLQEIEKQKNLIRLTYGREDWMLDKINIVWLDGELIKLQILSEKLPSHLHKKLKGFSQDVSGKYRALILSTWIATGTAALVFLLFMRLSYRWIFRPLKMLIAGSRRVASGEFSYRIHLDTRDEMAELAKALNDMTSRFQEIRDDLDRQVQIRTKQVVRSEQLASVGFLAAGVAHEINNPLASIAMCAESLESRFRETLDEKEPDQAVVANYLRMIQNEAFRCKGITEKLLDFSRTGPVKRENVDLVELIRGVIEMLRHLGKYQRKQIELDAAEPVIAQVNPQELKQVVLNLLTNALDSLDDGGLVQVHLENVRDGVHLRDGQTGAVPFEKNTRGFALLTVTDNGCGMTPDVQEHLFEPFFTRRRGGQGIGLGLSITYRIIADHGGTIEAHSAGVGKGSTFHVRLPLTTSQKENDDQRQAA